MRILPSWFAASALFLATPVFACDRHSDVELAAFMNDVLTLMERLDGATSRSQNLELGQLRERANRREPAVMNLFCQMLTNYPSMRTLIPEALALQQQAWEGKLQLGDLDGAKGSGQCLSQAGHTTQLAIKFIGESISNYFSGLCDSLNCVDGACAFPCGVEAILNVPLVVIDGFLATDTYTCFADHMVDMSDWSEDSLGILVKSSGPTLTEVEAQARTVLVPLADAALAQVGRQEVLDDAVADLSAGVDLAAAQLSSLDAGFQRDADRRREFQDKLERFHLEQQLLPSPNPAALGLRLPAAFGGQLERVREAVADAINANRQAGANVSAALALLRTGDASYNAQQFDPAFQAYRDAYLELLQ